MEFPAVFYIPLFLRANAPGWIPAEVAFLRTGLEDDSAEKTAPAALELEAAFTARLPFSRKEARAALAEMLALGLERAGALRQQAARSRLDRSGREQALDETAALEFFSHTGKVIPAAPSVPDTRNILGECQKILILARDLERERAEIAALTGRALLEEQNLRAGFGEGGEGVLAAPDRLAPFEDPPPWRIILDAALPFLPEKALLLTADSPMAQDLRDAGMLRPIPEDLAGRFATWPEAALSRLLLAEVPAWRLLGRTSLPKDRPWLERALEVLAARPED
ncbi:MAG: hypothetical protein LBJ82_01320, partial [Deltaproteobacteria bacterium]|nr:hypothetical protein [Deltaproteobacteria bacterium]